MSSVLLTAFRVILNLFQDLSGQVSHHISYTLLVGCRNKFGMTYLFIHQNIAAGSTPSGIACSTLQCSTILLCSTLNIS